MLALIVVGLCGFLVGYGARWTEISEWADALIPGGARLVLVALAASLAAFLIGVYWSSDRDGTSSRGPQ